jgi:hypothetical protein
MLMSPISEVQHAYHSANVWHGWETIPIELSNIEIIIGTAYVTGMAKSQKHSYLRPTVNYS